MQQFRHRWQDRFGVIVAVAGMGGGMLLCRPDVLRPDGIGLLAWLVALFVVVIPLVVFELGTGAIYQDSLSESCRKAGKHWEVVGWMGAGAAALAVLLLAQLGGRLCTLAFDSLLAAMADQPTHWVAHAEDIVAPHADGSLLALALVLGVVNLRLWRGAPGIGRTASVLMIVALSALLLVGGALLFHPGALDGLTALLSPGEQGFLALTGSEVWITAGITALVGWGCGTGAVTAYGSYLNRSTDAIGIGAIAVMMGAMGQLLLLVVVAIGGGVIVAGSAAVPSDVPAAIAEVARVLANCGLPAWWAGILLTVWFLGLLALVIPALLAMAEAVIAPVVDKFRLPRERVVPAVMVGVFFAVTGMSASSNGAGWCRDGLVWVLATTVIVQAACAVWAIRLDAVARHLNAYSAFHLGWGWRVSLALVTPLSAAALLIGVVGREGVAALVGGLVALMVLLLAVLITRLTGRGV
jgi:NSS family neurotransmitter:Na+ symporter